MFNIQENIDLKPFNSYKISCTADFFVQVDNLNELKEALTFSREKNIPYLIIGGASNILFSRERFEWLIIKNKITPSFYKKQNGQIILGSGQNLSTLAKIYPQLWGIPGTIWGAIRGNAGAFQLEMKDILINWLVYNTEEDTLITLSNSDFLWKHRHSYLKKQPHLILIEATFNTNLKKDNITLEEIKAKRSNQPKKPSCGSFFKNPDKNPAGWYIDHGCNLKGTKQGDAEISPDHANFLVNNGNASGQDILKLSTLCQQKVKQEFGIDLEPEVEIIK